MFKYYVSNVFDHSYTLEYQRKVMSHCIWCEFDNTNDPTNQVCEFDNAKLSSCVHRTCLYQVCEKNGVSS